MMIQNDVNRVHCAFLVSFDLSMEEKKSGKTRCRNTHEPDSSRVLFTVIVPRLSKRRFSLFRASARSFSFLNIRGVILLLLPRLLANINPSYRRPHTCTGLTGRSIYGYQREISHELSTEFRRPGYI